MSGVDELVAFLRAALDRDEQVAREAAEAARADEWLSGAEGSVFGMDEDSDLHIRGAVFSLDDIGVHIARWDPVRVLAEVQARRRILELHAPDGNGYCPTCDDNTTEAPCETVSLLAQPYAGQPGWRGKWAL